MAPATFSGVRPPARMTGTRERCYHIPGKGQVIGSPGSPGPVDNEGVAILGEGVARLHHAEDPDQRPLGEFEGVGDSGWRPVAGR